MKGFVPKKKTYRLEWVDGDLEGLMVRVSSPTLGEMIEITKLADLADREMKPEDMERVAALFGGFAKSLVSWNMMTEKGQEVPATEAGLYSIDFDVANIIIMKWIETVSQVSPPLPGSSQSGVKFPEGSIPMELPSLNLAS